MKLRELTEILKAYEYTIGNAEREIKGGYAGDFLSFVMSRAPSDCAWFTVMSNVNVCAVATLADVGVIVLCDGVKPSEQLLDTAIGRKVNLIGTELNVFDAIKTYSAYAN